MIVFEEVASGWIDNLPVVAEAVQHHVLMSEAMIIHTTHNPHVCIVTPGLFKAGRRSLSFDERYRLMRDGESCGGDVQHLLATKASNLPGELLTHVHILERAS